MRFINLIVVHCSATRCDRSYTEHDLTTDHLRRGFSGAGYQFVRHEHTLTGASP